MKLYRYSISDSFGDGIRCVEGEVKSEKLCFEFLERVDGDDGDFVRLLFVEMKQLRVCASLDRAMRTDTW